LKDQSEKAKADFRSKNTVVKRQIDEKEMVETKEAIVRL